MDSTWLFECRPPGTYPQFAVGKANKQAIGWFPGKNPKSVVPNAPLLGFTQLAFAHPEQSMLEQPAWICWVGLDVDVPVSSREVLEKLPGWDVPVSARTSTSGLGVHLLFRLSEPIKTTWRGARKIIKQITRPLRAACPWPVDKSDRRVFWLFGGKNAWIHRTPEFLKPALTTIVGEPAIPPVTEKKLVGVYSLKIGELLTRMLRAGIIPEVKPHVPIHVGTVVSWLRGIGETVETKSPMQNEPHINGYLDVSEFEIRLWAYADHATIWFYQDSEALLEAII